MQAPDLFSQPPKLPKINFSGDSYNPVFDYDRLNGLQLKVWQATQDGQWKTLAEILESTGCGAHQGSSITARLRQFNQEPLNAHFRMESQRKPGCEKSGVWLYRVTRRS